MITTLEILERMAENEWLLSELYSKYAKLFPEDSQFWNNISADEIQHEKWVKQFIDESIKQNMRIKKDRFSLSALNEFKKYIQYEIDRADSLKRINAVSVSIHAEDAMLEKKIFDVVETDVVNLKILLDNLRQSTEKHLQEVKLKFEEVSAEEKKKQEA